MKRIPILFFPVLLLLCTLAKASVIDSMENPQLWIEQQHARGKVMLENRQETMKAMAVFKNAIDFAKSQNLIDQFYDLQISYGVVLYRTGAFQESHTILHDVEPHLKKSDAAQRAKVNQVQGMNLAFQDRFSEGYKFLIDALTYYSDAKDSVGLMNIYYDIGASFVIQEQYTLGLKNYEKGIAIAKNSNDLKMIILGTTAIGGAHASLKDFEKALQFSNESISLAKELDDQEELAWASINRGFIIGIFQKALGLFIFFYLT